MRDNIQFFEGIWGYMDLPILIYSTGGKLLWVNKAAEDLLKISPEIPEAIFSKINDRFVIGITADKTDFGEFRMIHIGDEKLYLVELRNNEHNLLRFLNDPVVAEYIRRNDTLIRQTITGISASCEIISDLLDDSDNDEGAFCLDNIIKSCCHVMRNVSINSLLISVAEKNELNEQYINLDEFVARFVLGCKKALGKDFDLVITGKCGFTIKANQELLGYLFLIVLRNLLENSEFPAGQRLEISVSAVQNGADVAFITSGDFINSDNTIKLDAEYDLDNEFVNILAEKLGANLEYSENKVNIFLKSVENNGEVELSTDKMYFDDGIFSPYNIMLSDLTDDSVFY